VTQIRFFGGVDEVGGNKIYVRDGDVRIFLDFGMSFGCRSNYFEEYLKPRSSNGMGDLLATGLLPWPRMKGLHGMYRKDLAELRGWTDVPSRINAVFLTHAHADHVNYISFLRPEIPVYCGEVTRLIMEAVCVTGKRDIERELIDFKERPLIDRRGPSIKRRFATFRTGAPPDPEPPIDVDPVHVDHSVPGAYGYIVHTSGGAIVYTGDIRLHGRQGDMTREFVELAAEAEPRVLIIEGTRVGRTVKSEKFRNAPSCVNEQEVATAVMEVLEEAEGVFAVADFNFKDVDRVQTFWEGARDSGRRLVLTPKDAVMLEYLRKDPELAKKLPGARDEGIVIFMPKKGSGLYRKQDYDIWERKIFAEDHDGSMSDLYENVLKANEVNAIQGELLMAAGYFQMNDMVDIKPEPGSIYFHSHSEPLNEEMAIDEQRLSNWLEHFEFRRIHKHTSGHASVDQIRSIVKIIGAEVVYPIHCEEPEEFLRKTTDVAARVRLPKAGKAYTLGS
jgi:ribonuclease J